MSANKYITIQDYCTECNFEQQLLREFAEFGLVHFHVVDEQECLFADELEDVARLIRLYKDLNINKEGIDIILSMRKQIIELMSELKYTRYKLQKLEKEKHLNYYEVPLNSGLIIDIRE